MGVRQPSEYAGWQGQGGRTGPKAVTGIQWSVAKNDGRASFIINQVIIQHLHPVHLLVVLLHYDLGCSPGHGSRHIR